MGIERGSVVTVKFIFQAFLEENARGLVVRVVVLEQLQHSRALRLVILVEAGTQIIFDALMCPYRMGERV